MNRDPVELMKSVIARSGLPKARISMISGISPATLHAWLNGKRNPSPDSIHRLADAFEAQGGVMCSLAEELRASVK